MTSVNGNYRAFTSPRWRHYLRFQRRRTLDVKGFQSALSSPHLGWQYHEIYARSRSTEEHAYAPGKDFGDREQSLGGSLRGSGRATRTRRSVGKWPVACRRSCRAHSDPCAEPLPDATRAGEYRDLYANVAACLRQHTTERMLT